MADMTFEDDILATTRRLTSDQQRKVLDFAHSPERPQGEPGWRIVQHAREINFPKEDLAEIAAAIEEVFGQVERFPEVNLDADQKL